MSLLRRALTGALLCASARPGDSGGPLYEQTDHTAYGILSDGTNMKQILEMGLDAGVCHHEVERNSYTPISKIYDIANSFPAYVYRIIDHP